jgi:hypothetical protein
MQPGTLADGNQTAPLGCVVVGGSTEKEKKKSAETKIAARTTITPCVGVPPDIGLASRVIDTSLPTAAEGIIKLDRTDEFGIANLLERQLSR